MDMQRLRDVETRLRGQQFDKDAEYASIKAMKDAAELLAELQQAARFPVAQTEARSKTLRIRLTEAEADSLYHIAKRAGMTISEYCRRRIFE